MAGTNSSRQPPRTVAEGAGPAMILVEPQLADNIGAAARAMLNCGLTDLRLVRPRPGWPKGKPAAAAAGADMVLERARLYDSTPAAIADLHHVYAATARPRDMIKPIVTPRQAARHMRRWLARDEQAGVLFGPERAGLNNDDVVLAEALLMVPLNPVFASLNLAHAVLLVSYEWFQAGDDTPEEVSSAGRSRPATKAELVGLFEHLEAELDTCGFLHVAEKRPTMVRNIRNIFQRAGLTEQEVAALRGIITGLAGRKGIEGTRGSLGDVGDVTGGRNRPRKAQSRRRRVR